MANELVVGSSEEGLKIAILEDKHLAEIHYEKNANNFSVGDIFVGKVQSVLPSLNAVFVNIGHSKAAFLHYFDLGPQIKSQNKFLKAVMASKANIAPLENFTPLPDIDKNGKMADVLKPGYTVLVQIMKEAIQTKGPRLSSQISLAGQYLILLPFGDDVSVSRKFKSVENKKRVKRELEAIRPKQMGLIVRTAAEDVEFAKLEADLQTLVARWDGLVQALVNAKPPRKVLSEIDRTSGILRDMLSIGFDAIYTDNEPIFKDIGDYLQANMPEKRKMLQLRPSKSGIFESMGIEKQIKGLFGRTVNLSNGSYLIIEHTEALHVFDVNSGSMRFSDLSPEENAVRINCEAAEEIARQLRLRDMGGIIVIDFIDQKDPENKKKVYAHLKEVMARDRARHTILPMSRFGLIQITRQRVRPEINIVTDESCPACGGTGKIRPTILIADEIEQNVAFLLTNNKVKTLKLKMNPYIAAYFMVGFPSRRMRWFFKYYKWVRIEASTAQPFSVVRYFGEGDEEIKLE